MAGWYVLRLVTLKDLLLFFPFSFFLLFNENERPIAPCVLWSFKIYIYCYFYEPYSSPLLLPVVPHLLLCFFVHFSPGFLVEALHCMVSFFVSRNLLSGFGVC